jgi:hypothetical protein
LQRGGVCGVLGERDTDHRVNAEAKVNLGTEYEERRDQYERARNLWMMVISQAATDYIHCERGTNEWKSALKFLRGDAIDMMDTLGISINTRDMVTSVIKGDLGWVRRGRNKNSFNMSQRGRQRETGNTLNRERSVECGS